MNQAEVRILDGPNPDVLGPAIQVTLPRPSEALDLPGLADRIARATGHFAGPAVQRAGSGEGADHDVVVAFPWILDGVGEAIGRALAGIVAAGPAVPLEQRVQDAIDQVATTRPGDPPDLADPIIPTIAVTGTNGKTTTTRLLGRIAREAGLLAAWSSTDGVFADGRCVEAGDWSGPGGARLVLSQPEVSIAILETARGGLMRRGMGVRAVDVAVFTNVSADHLGLAGLDTVEQLAWAKATVVRVVRPGGWAVLNGEDSLVARYHADTPGRPWLFGLDPTGPAAALAVELGAPLTTVVDGHLVVRGVPTGDPDPDDLDLGDVLDMPVTIAGLSAENVANAAAAASAALAAGLSAEAVRAGLRSFVPDQDASSGRMNLWSAPTADGGSATVILDFAHNEAGAVALMRVATGLRAPGSAVHASIGNAGDRTDEGIVELARIVGAAADTVQLAAKAHYLRGRSQAEIDDLQREGLRLAEKAAVEEQPDEPAGLRALLDRAADGDVLAMMVHEDRAVLHTILAGAGATPDSPETVRAKAAAARSAR